MKTINNLIDKIVDLKIDLLKIENKNERLDNELKEIKVINSNLKKEVENLRLILTTKQQ
jgi:hypothetical protein